MKCDNIAKRSGKVRKLTQSMTPYELLNTVQTVKRQTHTAGAYNVNIYYSFMLLHLQQSFIVIYLSFGKLLSKVG